MDSNTFMGMLVICLATLVGLLGGFTSLFIKPINRLTEAVTRLSTKIESLEDEKKELKRKVDKHDEELRSHTKLLAVHEEELDRIEKEEKKQWH